MQILRETNLEALQKAKEMGADALLDLLEEKKVVGRGGAGFLTSKKWRIAKGVQSDAKYIICNADEGEAGTFKDKFIIKHNAKTLIEGILIAAFAINAKKCFIYLRAEYDYLRKRLEEHIEEVMEKIPDCDITIEIVRGAGAYVCGEETAIIQSIMGNRGHSMHKPPYPTIEGLWGKPTVVNNVETLTCIPQAILHEDWKPDLRLFSFSGNIRNPGIYELPLGVKMSSVVDIAQPSKKLKAISFGAFGGIMPVKDDMIIDMETIKQAKCHHGSFTLIFIDEDTNIFDISYSIAKFYTYESCGKCTPCREGTVRVLNLLKKVKNNNGTQEDLDMLEEFANHIQETSLCGLGQSAGNHILTTLKNFPEDYKRFLKK